MRIAPAAGINDHFEKYNDHVENYAGQEKRLIPRLKCPWKIFNRTEILGGKKTMGEGDIVLIIKGGIPKAWKAYSETSLKLNRPVSAN